MTDPFNLWLYAVLLIIAIWVATGLRVVSNHQRIAVFVLGRFSHLKGPGLLFKLPGSAAQWERLSIGDIGEFIGHGLAKFNEAAVPVKNESDVMLGQRLRLVGFGDSEVQTTADRSKKIVCDKCGNAIEV